MFESSKADIEEVLKDKESQVKVNYESQLWIGLLKLMLTMKFQENWTNDPCLNTH